MIILLSNFRTHTQEDQSISVLIPSTKLVPRSLLNKDHQIKVPNKKELSSSNLYTRRHTNYTNLQSDELMIPQQNGKLNELQHSLAV